MSHFQDDSKYLRKTLQKDEPVQRRKLGEVLVERQIVTPLTVERVLKIGRQSGRRFGEVLEELGLVTGEELAQALAIQYGYSVITDFVRFRYPETLLQLLPVETAAEFVIFPLKLQDGLLALAMADPTDRRVLDNLRVSNQVEIWPFVASRKEILRAIDVHYLKKSGERQLSSSVVLASADRGWTQTVGAVLARAGFVVIVAEDGFDAVKKALCHKPVLMLVEKEVPKLNAAMVLSSLKNSRETRDVPVILVAGGDNPEEEAQAYDKGFADYLRKPALDIILVTKVKKAVAFNVNPYVMK